MVPYFRKLRSCAGCGFFEASGLLLGVGALPVGLTEEAAEEIHRSVKRQ